MRTITLQNEEYFGFCAETFDIESKGELTGTYILSKHIKCENFQCVFCPDTGETFLISTWVLKNLV